MTVVMSVADLLTALRPVAAGMLRSDELRRARFWVCPHGAWEDQRPDDDVVDGRMTVAWKICGNRGGTGTLHLHDDERALLHAVAEDLQDFIAESTFAWGDLRPIPPRWRWSATRRRPGGAVRACTVPPGRRRVATGAVRPRRGPS